MALVKCLECGHKVSTKAQSCPGCGAPVVENDLGRETINSSISETVSNTDIPQSKSIAGVRKTILRIISFFLFLWAILLLVDTVIAFSMMPTSIALVRVVFAGALILAGSMAWKSGNKRE